MRDELETAKPRRLPWKRRGLTRAQQVVAFLQWLPVTKGRLAGRRMRLLPSQHQFIEAIFAEKDGRPIVDLAILSEPKGNGKSGLVAGICLAALLGPLSEERGAVFSASIDRGKAGIIFDEMKAIILRVPEFGGRCNIVDFHKKISVLSGDGFDSTFEALSADARRSQGLAPTVWAYDELGEAPDGALLSVLLESAGKRDHTLGIVLSTQAESDDHPLSRLIDDAETGVDPSVHLQIHRAPLDADPFADETLKAANPAWGHFLDLEALRKSRDRARRLPSYEPGYRRLRLNQRIDSRAEARLVTAQVWKSNAGVVNRDSLRGKVAFGGLDLASKHDLVACVLAFPTEHIPAHYDLIARFWTPEGQLAKRTPAERERFREWIAGGWIRMVPGDVVTTASVARDLVSLCAEFDVQAIAFDRWRIDFLKADLAELGVTLPLENFGQGHSPAMAPAVDFLAECALTARLRHGGHPVLTASVAGAIVIPDKAGNPMIDRPKSNSRGPVRIDGAIALTMAMGTAKGWVRPAPKPSVAGMLRKPVMVI